MSQTSGLPGARAVAFGTAMQPLQPALTTTGLPDNAMPEFQLEFTRVATRALSPWLAAGVTPPNYGAPLLAASLPPGTAIDVVYRGSTAAAGTNPTAWSTTPDVADGLPFLQFQITFVANLLTGERPLVDSLVVPIL
jgi:hypothetical protein